MNSKNRLSSRSEIAVRCHEIQAGLGLTEVPDFEFLTLIGMAVRLALNIRGLPIIQYGILRLVAYHFLSIPTIAVDRIVKLLEEVQFVKIQSEGQTIKAVLPTVPYYEDIYSTLGEYAQTKDGFNEAETLSLEIVKRLAKSPENIDVLRNKLGADNTLLERSIYIGEKGSYIVKRRCRGRDILLNPTYFSENADIFADIIASKGSQDIKKF